MTRILLILWLSLLGQLPTQSPENPPSANHSLEKSPYFAFVDRDYIFTIEVVKPGILLLNFVSMAEGEVKLVAKNIRIALDNRKAPVKLLSVETGDYTQPMRVGWLNVRPRSSFGVRLVGDFSEVKEISGAAIRLADEELKFAPLSSYDFEFLATRINRINLGSPDFSEDWRVLRFQKLGSRSFARKKE